MTSIRDTANDDAQLRYTSDDAQLRDAVDAYIAAWASHRRALAAARKLLLDVLDAEDALLARLDRKALQAVACNFAVIVARDEYWDLPRGERLHVLDGIVV